jgi:regulatory protein
MPNEHQMLITAIERQKRRPRVDIFVDGRLALSLSRTLVAQAGLRCGDAVTAEHLEALRRADERQQALDSALRLLAYRPRSEAELRTRLTRRKLPPAVVQETVDHLLERGLLDDEAFARYWVAARQQSSPRGPALLRRELLAKGIAMETTREALAMASEDEAARRAAEKKARSLRNLDYRTFRRRLGQFLLRRGFPYETARPLIDELWRESGRVTNA